MSTPAETVAQLNQARNIALGDATYYPQIVQGVLPLIGPNAALELRRWGSEFLAETFASPVVRPEDKELLALKVLELMRNLLEIPGEDIEVVKSVVQASASIYPLVFRHIIYAPHDAANWQTMTAIKSNILRRMDTAPPGIRICCIKFVQRVVQAQTPAVSADPRRPDKGDISLALVPRDHPVIPLTHLEAEGSGLLDRLLGLLQENNSDALFVTATLNCLGSLIRLRPTIANKIIQTVLTYNPFKLANSPMTPKTKVMIKSLEKTTMALLINVIKRNPNHPMTGRIHQYIDRLKQTRIEIFDESRRKRPAPIEPTDGLDQTKRQRLGAEVPAVQGQAALGSVPPLPAGPVSYAQLYTLTADQGSTSFDVKAIPVDVVVRLLPPLLLSIDNTKLNNAVNAIKGRFTELQARPKQAPPQYDPQAAGVDDDDDDYEPDYEPAETAEQIGNRLDNAPPDDTQPIRPPDVALGPFRLPQPPPLTEREIISYGQGTIQRVMSAMTSTDLSTASKPQKAGFNRLAASNFDRDAWVTLITRIATRASAGLESESNGIKREDSNSKSLARNGTFSMSNAIRESIFAYIMEDFRRRIDVAISWLNEEWFNDRIQQKQLGDRVSTNYENWVLRLLDQMKIYLEAKDKVLIRFLSEIPELSKDMLERVKELARDPERVGLAVQAIHYLVLLRPPVRDICIDALEDLWRNYEDAKTQTAKLLQKWRPHVLQEEPNGAAPAAVVKAE